MLTHVLGKRRWALGGGAIMLPASRSDIIRDGFVGHGYDRGAGWSQFPHSPIRLSSKRPSAWCVSLPRGARARGETTVSAAGRTRGTSWPSQPPLCPVGAPPSVSPLCIVPRAHASPFPVPMPFVQEVAPYSIAHELLALNGIDLLAMIPKVHVRSCAHARITADSVLFCCTFRVGLWWLQQSGSAVLSL